MNAVREKLFEDLLFAEFGERQADDGDVVIEAVASMAARRYGDAPWVEDRIGDAAEAAVVAEWMYRPRKGQDNVFYRANFVVGSAAGLMRAGAREESAAFELVSTFSDLIPLGSEDEEEYLERVLGKHAIYSPPSTRKVYDDEFEFDIGNSVFYTSNGVVTLHEAAERIAHTGIDEGALSEMFITGDFSPVNDLTDEIYERLVTWATSNDAQTELSEDNTEPETCPLDWVWMTRLGDDGKPDWSQASVDLRRAMTVQGHVGHGPNEAFIAPYDWVSETWKSVSPRVWSEWRKALDAAKYDAWHSDSQEKRIKAVNRAKRLQKLALPMRGNIDDRGCPGFWSEYANPETVWARSNYSSQRVWKTADGKHEKKEVLAQNNYVEDLINEILDRKELCDLERPHISDLLGDEILEFVLPAVEYAVSLNIGDTSYNQVMTEYARLVSSRVFVKGTLAMIKSVAGVEWDSDEEVEPVVFRTEPLREALIEEVQAGNVWAAQAVVVIAKLNGVHPRAAKKLGARIADRSRVLKKAVNQQRFSPITEMLIAEIEYPAFGFDLPTYRIGIVGDVDADYVERVIGRIKADAVIIGATDTAREIAKKLEMRYIHITPVDNTPRALRWANGQVVAVSTHLIASGVKNRTAKAKQLDGMGITYRLKREEADEQELDD